LKVNGQIVFHYFFDESGCKMQTVKDGVVKEEWEVAIIKIEMRD
jgi:hypothetical protein